MFLSPYPQTINGALKIDYVYLECSLLNFDVPEFQKIHPAKTGVTFIRKLKHLDSNPRR